MNSNPDHIPNMIAARRRYWRRLTKAERQEVMERAWRGRDAWYTRVRAALAREEGEKEKPAG